MKFYASKLRQSFSTVLFAAALVFAFTLCSTAGYAAPSGGCSGVPNITVGGTTYAATWCQEFNGAAGSAIDTSVWNFDLGNNGGWGNGEQEVYCGPPGYPGNPSQCPTTFSASTAPVYIDGNGHLVIRPIYENGAWLSGRMQTENKENFTYGILVASLEGPNTSNQGLWPAWWALGSNISTVPWPTCGESDIFENWSPQVLNGAGPGGNNSTIHTAKTGGSGVGARYTFPSGQATDTAFHTYGIVWQANNMQFYVDNPSAPFFTATPGSLPSGDTWPFNQSMFAILNVAVGGTLGGSTSGLASPASPMTVDYVRWYTPVTGGGGSCTTVPSAPTGLAASGTSSSGTTLNWNADAAPANCSISSYTILKNGVSIGTATGTSFTVSGLSASTTYSFTVEATDAAGTSSASSVLTVTTSPANVGEGPYPSTPAAIPGTVMAENYDTGGQGVGYNVSSINGSNNGYRTDGVDLEAAAAPATGNDLGWTAAGQWFRYTVNVATAGTYKVSFLVAAPAAVTDAFHVSNSSGANLSGSVNVPATGGYQTWVTITANVTLPAGTQTLTLDQDAGGWNIASFAFALTSGGGGTGNPYGGTPAAIPGTVMNENYDTGGQGVGYNVSSTNGS